MEIPRSILDELTESINKLSEITQRAVLSELEEIEWESIAELRKKVTEIVDRYLEGATDIAASYSANTYDIVRYLAVGEVLGAEAISGYDKDAIEGAVRALIQEVVDSGIVSPFFQKVLDRIDYELKRSAGRCTEENALKDPLKPRFARVPTGAETCNFCIMLASRGFVYLSKETAGKYRHYHAHCDCRIVQGYKGMKVAGYDQQLYYDMYKNPEKYPELKDARNKRRRELRAQKKEIEERKNKLSGASPAFVTKESKLYQNAKNIKKKEGYYDAVIHSDGDRFFTERIQCCASR